MGQSCFYFLQVQVNFEISIDPNNELNLHPGKPFPFSPWFEFGVRFNGTQQNFFTQRPMLHFYFVLIFVGFRWNNLLYSDPFLHLPHLKRNPFRTICRLYFERNDSASREGHFLLNNWYPGSLPSCELLWMKTPSVRVVASTSFIFDSREKVSRNYASLSPVDEMR